MTRENDEFYTTERLQEVASYAAATVFSIEAIADIPVEKREENGLGCKIAAWAEWDGPKIIRVFRAALEDASFHKEAAIVDNLIAMNEC